MIDPKEKNILVSESKPEGFNPSTSVVGCYIKSDDKYLFLKKAKGRNSELTWGVAGGRVEKNESPQSAVIREVYEETGIKIDLPGVIHSQTLYVINPYFCDYTLYLYLYDGYKSQKVKLSDEHTDFTWVSLDEAKKLPLLLGGIKSLTLFEKNIE